MNPYTTALDVQREAWQNATELVGTFDSAPDAAASMAEVEVGGTESEVVYEENKLRLLHYEPLTEEQHDVPILVVYALINRPYILDLQPDRSVVRTLLENGFDVYLIDWGEPSTLDASLTLEDYVDRYIDNCVDVVRERSGQESVNLLGYCMGGTMSAMYAALHPEKVRTLGLMAAGLCFAGEGGVLERWGDEEHFDPRQLRETFGNVPSEFLDVGFALMDPVANTVTKYVRLYENMDDEDFVENFARMEQWIGDGIDVAGDTFVQFIEDVYQENKLYENDLYLDGTHVDVENIDMPVLQIVAEYDHLIPPGASKPFNDVVGSDDVTTMEFPTGHIGMSVSSRSHAELWPDVCEWFQDRSAVEEPEAEPPAEAEERTAEEAPDAALAEDVAGDETCVEEEPQETRVEEEPQESRVEEEAIPEDEAAEPELGLDAIDGVGPTYADRLNDVGIESVEQLAGADPVELAAISEIAVNRLEDWVEQAQEMSDES